MSPDLQQCEELALKLTLNERAVLVEHLLASLDQVDDIESERLWVREAEDRYQAYKEGRVEARPADDVIFPRLRNGGL